MALHSSAGPRTPARTRSTAFERVLSNARFANGGTLPAALAIASAVSGEGRSHVARRLVETASTSGAKTLLVDCDLRGRGLSLAMGAYAGRDLLAAIARECPLEEAVVGTNVANLSFLGTAAQYARPAELLASAAFSQLVQDAASRYDLVVIDTPPVCSFVDAAEVGRASEGTLLVVRQDRTGRSEATAAARQLRAAGVALVGCVLNHASDRAEEPVRRVAAPDGERDAARGAHLAPRRWGGRRAPHDGPTPTEDEGGQPCASR